MQSKGVKGVGVIKAVLFDLFDTIVLITEKEENYYPRCLRKLYDFLVENGVEVSFEKFSRVYFEVRNKLYAETSENFEEPHFNVRVSLTLKKLGYEYDVSDRLVAEASMVFAEEFMRYVALDNNAINVLSKLRRKYKLGLITNFAISECVWKLLEKFDLEKFFDVIVISAEINRRKPSPEIFKKALKALNVNASEAIFVGDTIGLDVKGAKNAGIKSVLVKRRPIKEMDVKPDRIINNLKELPVVLEEFKD